MIPDVSQLSEADKFSFAQGLIGTKWRPGGKTVEDGLDCFGLVQLIYRECLGLEVPDCPQVDYKDPRSISLVVGKESPQWTEKAFPDDWTVVGMSSGRYVHHVGLWLDNRVLHATPSTGVVYQSVPSLRVSGLSPRKFWNK